MPGNAPDFEGRAPFTATATIAAGASLSDEIFIRGLRVLGMVTPASLSGGGTWTFQGCPGAVGKGAVGAVVVAGGIVTAVTVTNGGGGYPSSGTVLIGGVGTGAAGTFTATNGVIQSVTVTSGGSGYVLASTTAVFVGPFVNIFTANLSTGAQAEASAGAIATSQYYQFSENDFGGLAFLRLRSGTSGAPITQGASCSVIFILAPG